MSSPANPIVIIPARMQSSRLPGKPLADIHGEAMIVHVWRRGVEADVGPVVVACAEPEIVEVIEAAGGRAILTRPDHASGSDRIFEALGKADPERKHDAIVNVQGDLPTVEAEAVRACLKPLDNADVDIATIAAVITEPSERANPNVVKAVVGLAEGQTIGRAHYFSRATVPAEDGPLYHHIGLYTFRRDVLERFVTLPQGVLEARERLEQLRALENNMRIDVALVDTVPLGVDTPADLERARGMLTPAVSR
jgi:3-deoxy-manno-octulosonate cytidylyltransferase (CMP-KDO synthetase)